MHHLKHQLLAVFIVSGCSFLALALLVAGGFTQPVDQNVLLGIHAHSTSFWDSFFVIATEFGGSAIVTVAGLVILASLLILKKHRKALFLVFVMIGMILLNLLFKDLIGRQRPDAAGWLIGETGLSFPSGHATAVMALGLALCVLLWNTRWRWAAVMFASIYILVVSFSRLYVGVHFPSDIVGGWLLSIMWVSAVLYILRIPLKRIVREDVS